MFSCSRPGTKSLRDAIEKMSQMQYNFFRLLERIQTEDLKEVGYDYLTGNHRHNYVDQIPGCHTQIIERIWGIIK